MKWPWESASTATSVGSETVFPREATKALVDRLDRAPFAELVPIEELMELCEQHGARGPDVRFMLENGLMTYLSYRTSHHPHPDKRPKLRWIPALQAWAKVGRVLC